MVFNFAANCFQDLVCHSAFPETGSKWLQQSLRIPPIWRVGSISRRRIGLFDPHESLRSVKILCFSILPLHRPWLLQDYQGLNDCMHGCNDVTKYDTVMQTKRLEFSHSSHSGKFGDSSGKYGKCCVTWNYKGLMTLLSEMRPLSFCFLARLRSNSIHFHTRH